MAQQGITQDSSLALDMPVVAVWPDSLQVAHRVGDATARVLTITDEGATEVAFELAGLGETVGQTLRRGSARGGTALHDALCGAVEFASRLQAEDKAAGEKRL